MSEPNRPATAPSLVSYVQFGNAHFSRHDRGTGALFCALAQKHFGQSLGAQARAIHFWLTGVPGIRARCSAYVHTVSPGSNRNCRDRLVVVDGP